LASGHRTWLAGPDTGEEPTRAGTLPDRLLTPLMWFVATRFTTRFRPQYDWLDIPLPYRYGAPANYRGVIEACPGLYLMGLPALRERDGFEVVGGPATSGSILNRRYSCPPLVYIDGVLVTHTSFSGKGVGEAAGEAAAAIDMVHPLDVAGIEIYRGPAQTPGEFGGSNARCGVIVVWTRGR
jgi:hypothetical protein